MKTLRVCIGCNDGVRLAPTHMGDTRRFLIYDVYQDQQATFVDERENTAIDMEHAGREKMAAVIEILSDADVFVGTKKSPNFRKIAANTRYQPVVVKATTIHETLDVIKRSFPQIRDLVVARQNGERTETYPEY